MNAWVDVISHIQKALYKVASQKCWLHLYIVDMSSKNVTSVNRNRFYSSKSQFESSAPNICWRNWNDSLVIAYLLSFRLHEFCTIQIFHHFATYQGFFVLSFYCTFRARFLLNISYTDVYLGRLICVRVLCRRNKTQIMFSNENVVIHSASIGRECLRDKIDI